VVVVVVVVLVDVVLVDVVLVDVVLVVVLVVVVGAVTVVVAGSEDGVTSDVPVASEVAVEEAIVPRTLPSSPQAAKLSDTRASRAALRRNRDGLVTEALLGCRAQGYRPASRVARHRYHRSP